MTRQILLDVDDVLLNWIGGFAQYAATRLQNSVVGLPDSWNMGEWLGTTNEAAFELIEEFNVSVHFGRLVSVDGSQTSSINGCSTSRSASMRSRPARQIVTR